MFKKISQSLWSPYVVEYDPIKAGSIDGTDTIPHDHAVVRATCAVYRPPSEKVTLSNPKCTLFVGRLDPRTSQEIVEKEFSHYGKVKSCKLVRDIVTGASRGYAFVEFSFKDDAERAWRKAHSSIVDGQQVVVEWEFARTMPGWIPRRLGGGLGGRKESGQLRFGGRDRPFKKPIIVSAGQGESSAGTVTRISEMADDSRIPGAHEMPEFFKECSKDTDTGRAYDNDFENSSRKRKSYESRSASYHNNGHDDCQHRKYSYSKGEEDDFRHRKSNYDYFRKKEGSSRSSGRNNDRKYNASASFKWTEEYYEESYWEDKHSGDYGSSQGRYGEPYYENESSDKRRRKHEESTKGKYEYPISPEEVVYSSRKFAHEKKSTRVYYHKMHTAEQSRNPSERSTHARLKHSNSESSEAISKKTWMKREEVKEKHSLQKRKREKKESRKDTDDETSSTSSSSDEERRRKKHKKRKKGKKKKKKKSKYSSCDE